jgi:hypothetical protein
MNEHIPFGTIIETPSRSLCRCGDGKPHYHLILKVWDGDTWCLDGTDDWDSVVAKMSEGLK